MYGILRLTTCCCMLRGVLGSSSLYRQLRALLTCGHVEMVSAVASRVAVPSCRVVLIDARKLCIRSCRLQ